MNKNIKKLLFTAGVIILLLLAFAGGVLASNWKNFEGESSGEKVENNIDILVDLIGDLNDQVDGSNGENDRLVEYYEKVITELQEQFTEQLRIVTESKDNEILELQIETQTLLEEIEILKNSQSDNDDYIKHLESEIDKANSLLQKLEDYSNGAVESVTQ